MGAGANVWNNIAVYPLWVTMGAGVALLTGRVYQWIGYDQDIQVYKQYRACDPADSDFLETQGPAYYNHAIRKWLHSRTSPLIFPEPTITNPSPSE